MIGVPKDKIRESTIERKLVEEVQRMGGKAIKLNSVNTNGLMDRMIVLPRYKVFFVECKAPGKKLTPLQRRMCHSFIEMGQLVYKLDSLEGAIGVLTDATLRMDGFLAPKDSIALTINDLEHA